MTNRCLYFYTKLKMKGCKIMHIEFNVTYHKSNDTPAEIAPAVETCFKDGGTYKCSAEVKDKKTQFTFHGENGECVTTESYPVDVFRADEESAESLAAIMDALPETLTDKSYRVIWMSHVAEDVLSEFGDEINCDESAASLIAEWYCMDGDYDCNQDYWSQLEALVNRYNEMPDD